jgi:hypothetical protein
VTGIADEVALRAFDMRLVTCSAVRADKVLGFIKVIQPAAADHTVLGILRCGHGQIIPLQHVDDNTDISAAEKGNFAGLWSAICP